MTWKGQQDKIRSACIWNRGTAILSFNNRPFCLKSGRNQGNLMCKLFFGLAVATGFAASLFLIVGTATASPYKWCAISGGKGGATNCGFVTLAQCRATVSGVGGSCTPNQFYTGPYERPAKRIHKRHRD